MASQPLRNARHRRKAGIATATSHGTTWSLRGRSRAMRTVLTGFSSASTMLTSIRLAGEPGRKLDPEHRICAHGVAGTLDDLPYASHNEWRSAAKVDVWGLTWIAARKGDEPWKQFHAMDLVRAGARGKPFWHAEAEGGPLWMQPQVIGRPKEDGRIPDAEDVRIWNLVSCAAGARGLLYCRWRPLLDGPLFGAFGPFAMDGSETPRSDMAAVWRDGPTRIPIFGSRSRSKAISVLCFVPEAEIFNYMQQGDTAFYAQSIRGAYQAFFDSNIQPDFVSIDDIGEYKIIYLPYPVMLSNEAIAKIRKFVEQGGALVSEGLPAYFGDHGHVGTVQPNYGLDEFFGARESQCRIHAGHFRPVDIPAEWRRPLWTVLPPGVQTEPAGPGRQNSPMDNRRSRKQIWKGPNASHGLIPWRGLLPASRTCHARRLRSLLQIAGVPQR